MTNLPSGLSRRAYAKRVGISESAIRQHIAKGTLAPALLPDDTIDPAVADRLLATSITRGKVVPVTLNAAKTRRLRAQVRKLNDEFDRLRGMLIDPADAAAEWRNLVDLTIAPYFRQLPDTAAPLVVGLTGDRAHLLLRDAVIEVLEIISAEPGPDTREEPDEMDLATLSPVALEALRANLHAQKMELERARSRGLLIDVEEFATTCTERLAIAKSQLLALPSRVATQVESATIDEVRVLLSAEIEQALATLRPESS